MSKLKNHIYTYTNPLDGKSAPRDVPWNVYVIGIALVIGLIVGTGAQALKYVVMLISKCALWFTRPDGWNWVLIILPLIGIMLAVLYQKYIIKDQIAHGVERMKKLLDDHTPVMPMSQIWSPIVASGFTLGFGGSAGTEGPIATVGGAMGANMARWCSMPAPYVQAMLAIGAGAGIAGIFKAPVGGMLFAIEVLGIGMSALQILALATACTAAAMAAYILSGLTTDVTFPSYVPVNLDYIPWAVIVGVFCGLYSAYYNWLGALTRRRLERLKNRWYRALAAGLSLGLMMAIFPRLWGEGYTFVTGILNGHWDMMTQYGPFASLKLTSLGLMAMALGVMLVKGCAVACTTSGGGVAGEFAPAIFAGSMSGFFFALVVNSLFGMNLPVADFSFFGMAAVLAATQRAPLMAMFLVTEMAQLFSMLLPVAVASAVSYMVVSLVSRSKA